MHSTTVAGDGSHLPEKESIAPNQHSWPETAVQMGVKRCGKGKVNSALTAQHIGKPNRKRATDGDPYGAGEQSDKRAKPDVRSAAANARARAAREQPAPKVPLPSSQPLPMLLPPSTPLPLPAMQPLPALFPPPMPLPLPSSQPALFPPSASFPSFYTPNIPYYHHHYHLPPPLSQSSYSPSQGAPSYYPISTYSFPPQ